MEPIFVGIGGYGTRIAFSIRYGKRIYINPTGYLFLKNEFLESLRISSGGYNKIRLYG